MSYISGFNRPAHLLDLALSMSPSSVMSVDHLAPKIREILSAPDTDLSTVSAKHVRKQLLELEPEITLEYIKENKDAIDALIGGIFEGMNDPNAGIGVGVQPAYTVTGYTNGKRKREDDDEREDAGEEDEAYDSQGEDERNGDEGDEPEDSLLLPATPKPKKQKKAKPQEVADEEYARQLSSELNQRPSRGGRKSNGTSKKGASRTPKKVKKSRAQIEDDSDVELDAGGEGSTRKRKQTKPAKKTGGSGGGAKGGFAKEFALSEPLAALIDTQQLSRPQVVKRLWQYIRQHDLQNPKNRKEIICDDALRAVFNSDKIDMFSMNKTLGQHLYELES